MKAAAVAASAAASRPLWAQQAPAVLSSASPNSKIAVACIGVGGRGGAHIGPAAEEKLVAICDVQQSALDKVKQKHPDVKCFNDYRKMFDQIGKEFDAVFVATPDHHHYMASMLALQAGKHCYTEKPLTWSVEEARKLAETTAAKKLSTQMGNQGHANKGNRLIVEWIRDGAIGEIKEVHTWTNRPVWPQGNISRGEKAPVPEGLSFEEWIGPAPWHDYSATMVMPRPKKKKGKDGKEVIEQGKAELKSPYIGFNWRGWFDYGCGAIGDMGCHSWDNVFWSLNPDYPEYLELLDIVEPGKETFAKQTKFKWVFPAKGNRPGFVAYWYSGGLKPEMPEEMVNDPIYKQSKKEPKLPGSGTIYIGTKGKMLIQGDYGDSPSLLPEATFKTFKESRAGKTSPNAIEPSPGHYKEFFMAAKGEKPWNFPKSNFADYAGPLTEVMLLGCICERLGQVGMKIECDPFKRIVKTPAAAALVKRQYRKGWAI